MKPLALFSCLLLAAGLHAQIIPLPASIELGAGEFVLPAASTISASDALVAEGEVLRKLLGATAQVIETSKSEAPALVSFVLAIDTTLASDEAYLLDITPAGITLAGGSAAGVFYGIQSLRQLLPSSVETGDKLGSVSIPVQRISDTPRYKYRGMHLDVSRHFFTVEEVKTYLDMLAMHKMNRFHWHLTDDQGWRIEIKKYPLLTEVGGFRSGTAIGSAGSRDTNIKYDSIRYGGFYTQEEIKEVVAYAKTLHISVIPEIELPGHASAALAAYPELGNGTGPYEVARKWGVFEESFAPSDRTFSFFEDVLTEVMGLFPSPYIHIGGDEMLKAEWENSAEAQALMKRENLADEHELQSYFIQRVERFVNSKGRSIIGWDEILEGGLAPNATVMSWRGEAGGIAAAQQGHDVIMTPTNYLYFDYYQSDTSTRGDEPYIAFSHIIRVEDVYAADPTPAVLTAQEATHILGAQANLWTEYVTTFERAQFQVLPRMTALSEVIWSPQKSREWSDFQDRLQNLVKRYDALGWNYARYALPE